MAYALDDEQQNQAAQQQGTPAEPPTTSAAPGAGPGAQTKGGAPQATPAQPFQNLQAYLGANQSQVGDQANNISSDFNNQYGQIESDIGAGQQDFGAQVQQGYSAPNDQLVEQAASNPANFVSNPNNVTAFQSLYNDTYTGPSNFETSTAYGDLNSKVNKATADASLVNTVPGLETYYQSKNPNATKGGSILDSVLLSGTPEAYGKVTSAAKQFESLPDYLSNAVSTANQGVNAAQQTAQDTAANTKNRFIGESGIIPTFQSGITTGVQNARESVKSAYDLAVQHLTNGTPLTNEDAAALNTDSGDVMQARRLSGDLQSDYQVPFDFNNYLQSQNPNAVINPANFSSRADYEKAAALAQLTGQDLSATLNPADIGQAGTAPTTVGNLNAHQAQNDLYAQLRQHDTQYLQTHPQPNNIDPALVNMQMHLIQRNPSLLNNPSWLLFYQTHGGVVPGPAPTPNVWTPPGTEPAPPPPDDPRGHLGFGNKTPGVF